ncbi:MAG: hypothetical protein J5I92_08030 [Thiogranum sp.]|nr:hypothetical protein [Thiogranum sp.]
MQELLINNISTQTADDGTKTLGATFVSPRRPYEVWFRTDGGAINDSAEPFLPAALIPSMRRGWTIRVDGALSPALVEGAQQIQNVMCGWYRELQPVSIEAQPRAHDDTALPRAVAAFFSGGVDSFFTLQQHRDELTHLVFVHGFDLPLDQEERRREMANNARQVAEQLQLQLVEVETNMRDFGDRYVNWEKAYFGAGLGAVALLLAPRFARIYLPASVSHEQVIPMGSHPDLDHHWSNGRIDVLHDGVEYGRFDKIQAIADWPLIVDHLRVCYQPVNEGLNCGRCHKCQWTMMILEALGRLDAMRVFPSTTDPQLLRQWLPVDEHQRDRFRKAIRVLEQRNADPALRALLQELLDEGTKARRKAWLRRLPGSVRRALQDAVRRRKRRP